MLYQKNIDNATMKECLDGLRVGIMTEEKNSDRIENREQEVIFLGTFIGVSKVEFFMGKPTQKRLKIVI